ncbi:hypothetical protein K474DRAFT_1192196 [Panus rudis PR-1116 ss-1]|nr:hypothetical protein K474DRAFT_1192196 [Panus rudis PR-1116 ss-1]
MHDRISVEASKWREAVVPNATEVQSVLRQFATYSGMTQQKAYAYVYPLFIYMVFFILAAIMLPPGSCAHHVLVDPLNHEADLAVGFTLLLGSLIMGLILLRLMIWGAALFVGWLIKLEIQGKQRRSRGGSPGIGSLLGGLLTT